MLAATILGDFEIVVHVPALSAHRARTALV
jgi:hypothetical protein